MKKKIKKMAFGGMSGPGGFGGPMGGIGRGGMGGPMGRGGMGGPRGGMGGMPVPQVMPERLTPPPTTAETFIPRSTVSGAPAPDYGTMNQRIAMKKGGKVKSASARADGIAIRGKTRA